MTEQEKIETNAKIDAALTARKNFDTVRDRTLELDDVNGAEKMNVVIDAMLAAENALTWIEYDAYQLLYRESLQP